MSKLFLFPADKWTREDTPSTLQGMSIYRLNDSELRVAYIEFVSRGASGYFVLFRAHDDAKNMEMTVFGRDKVGQFTALIAAAVVLCSKAPLSNDKFMTDLEQWYRDKTGVPTTSAEA